LLWIAYADIAYTRHPALKLVLFCVAGGFSVLWSIIPRPDRFEAPGPRLDSSREPELFASLAEVADATAQQMPAEVYLVNDVNAFVTQRGGIMGIGSRRVMGLGLPLMHAVTVQEFKAILAHEFGHYHSGDVALGPWIHKTRAAIGRTRIADAPLGTPDFADTALLSRTPSEVQPNSD
jgi:heat shock protein HtpX